MDDRKRQGKSNENVGLVSNVEPLKELLGTRTVPVPGNGEPNIQGVRTERFRYPSVIV